MSFELIKQVWQLDLKPTQQHVLMALADYADDDGRNCFPSHGRLAWKLGCTVKTVARIIPELIGLGVVEVLRPATNKQPARYRICLENGTPKEPYCPDNDDSRVDNLSTQDQSRVDNLSGQDGLGGQFVTSRVDNLSARVDKLSTDPISNQSTNQPDNEIGPLPEKEQEKETAAETAQKWAACVQELGVGHRTMGQWLQGSELLATGQVRDGKALYRLLVVNPGHVDWLKQQAGHAIRTSIRGALGPSVAVDIVAELAAQP